MRAAYLSKLSQYQIEDTIRLDAKDHYHLLNVVRVKIGDDLLLLDGKGLQIASVIAQITHKDILIHLQSKEIKERPHEIDVAIGICKKDAMDLALKMAVELAVCKLIPLRMEYSQGNFVKKDRLERILISSLEQSNASFLPQILEGSTIDQVDTSEYQKIFYFSLTQGCLATRENILDGKSLLIIGPEGGLSEREETFLAQHSHVVPVRFPSYILRTTTALSAAMGWVFAQSKEG